MPQGVCVVEVSNHSHTICLDWLQSCCHNLGKDPGGQGEAEGEYPNLIMVALKGKMEEARVISRNWDMKIAFLQVNRRDQ